jgi:CRISPR/Cas system endoribonuclease Cas6 (RAMP superfamily)
MRLDVTQSRELRAVIFALRGIDKTLQKQVRVHTKEIAGPEWRKALAERADTRLEHRVIHDTAVVGVTNQNVRVQSAMKGRPLSGGLNPKVHFYAVEFGAKLKKTTYYRKSRKGGTHKVTRTVGGFPLKPRRKGGYVFYPAAKEMIPRIGSIWAQTTVHTLALALEGKQE